MVESTSTSLTTILPQVMRNVAQITFSWYDYLLFFLMLSFSVMIGIYFGCFGTKQSTANEYLMGNRKMKVLPIAVSLVASHISGLTLLGVPADVYRYGAGYWLFVLSMSIIAPCTIFSYLPVFYKLQITSTYEYLERRFNSTNRLFGSFLYALNLFLYLPIVIYVPALAFSAATRINTHYITPLVCGVCIFYTTLGGLRAVVWTDTLQFTITIAAVFTVTVIGVNSGGGFAEVYSTALKGHRLDIFDFNPDPTLRDSFWIVTIGITLYWLSMVVTHQTCIQKFLSVPTLSSAKLSVAYFAFGMGAITSFSVFIGLVMYARYAKCDPFAIGVVQKNDQLLPYYVMDVASHIPGLSGLFIAGIFCAALSTLSASLNCLAGTIYEDFVLKITGPVNDERKTNLILKLIVVITGIMCTGLVFVIERLGGLLPLGLSLGGVTCGPLLGMFTLGVLFPKASSKGTYYGAIIGLLLSSWIVVMAQYYKSQGMIVDIPRPTSIEGCMSNNTSIPQSMFIISSDFSNVTTNQEVTTSDTKPFFLFRISHYYFSSIGTAATMIIGLLISYLMKNDDPPVHRDLLSPVIYFMLPNEMDHHEKTREYHSLHKALHLVTADPEEEEKA